MSWLEDQYAIETFMSLPRYKMVASSPMRLNARCPICGDSKKDEYKARFWYYYYENLPMVHCYNCDHSAAFTRFLHEHDPDLFGKYQIDLIKENGGNGAEYKPREVKPSEKLTKTMNTIQSLKFSQRLDGLPENHPIIKYVNERKIPKDKFNRLWFTSQWQELANSVAPGTFSNPRQEYRLVIPIFNKFGQIESFQGRALGPSSIKYMTIKTDENSSKVYGQDTVDDSCEHVFVTEGPIDSLFLDNAIAITGGSLSLDAVPYPDKRIWVLDNEPRHPDTLNRMESLIEAGEKVLFWDDAPWQSKDINDMVKNDGATKADLHEYILNNYASGLMARVRMMKYRKL